MKKGVEMLVSSYHREVSQTRRNLARERRHRVEVSIDAGRREAGGSVEARLNRLKRGQACTASRS